VFFDEMDSIFRTRGSGVSSDVETTIVPQLLAEIDGVEGWRTSSSSAPPTART
jgi:proteasome-associated ATPase